MQQRYPAVRIVVQHGAILAWLIPALFAVSGAVSLALHWSPWLLAGLIIGAAALFCVLRVVVELVQIIAETLLPQ